MEEAKATIKQKLTFKEVVKGSTITAAMSKAGYAKTTASRTNKVTRTKGWEALLQQHLPDSTLAKKHRELLNKRETIVVSDGAQNGSHIEYTDQPHSDASKALDMAYKLKKKYPKESEGNTNNILLINVTAEGAAKYGIKTNTSPSTDIN